MGGTGLEASRVPINRTLPGPDFVADLQDLLGGADEEPRPLSATPFDPVGGQIRDGNLASGNPERGRARAVRGGVDRDPVAVARLLRALADLLEGGGER